MPAYVIHRYKVSIHYARLRRAFWELVFVTETSIQLQKRVPKRGTLFVCLGVIIGVKNEAKLFKKGKVMSETTDNRVKKVQVLHIRKPETSDATPVDRAGFAPTWEDVGSPPASNQTQEDWDHHLPKFFD